MEKVDPDDMLQRQIAEALGVTPRTIVNKVKAGCPIKANRRYRLKDVARWWISQQTSPNGAAESQNLESYRAARAELVRMELAKKKGELVSYDKMIRCWGGRIKMFRDSLLYLVDRLPPLLAGLDRNEIRAILKTEAEYILNEFSRNGQFTPETAERASLDEKESPAG